jgi:hypothetical protein
MALTGAGHAVRLDGRAMTPEYFGVFDVGLQVGRTFQPGDVEPGNETITVSSNATWETCSAQIPDREPQDHARRQTS